MAMFLLLGLAASVLPSWAQYQHPCRETKHGPDSGLIRMPDFEPPHSNVTCVWSRPSQSGKKILVRVDSVHFPPDLFRQSSLKLELDDDIIDIPRNCVRCLKQNFVSSGSVKVIYRSVLLDHLSLDESITEPGTQEVGSFQLRFRSFDPVRCDSPKQPLNGFASVSSRQVGHQVVYGCLAPYDVLGPDRAMCHVKDELDSPVPEWSAGPPKCLMTNCSFTVYRIVGAGAIASPGYPLYVIPHELDCRWVLQTERGKQIQVNITFLQMSGKTGSFGTLSLYDQESGKQLASYNQSSDKSVSLIANSSEVVVTLLTSNNQTVKGGFYMEYSLVEGSCSEPSKPENGDVLFTSLSIGSSANYRCLPGYNLSSDAQILCQKDGTWSAVFPRCVLVLDVENQDFSSEDDVLLSTSTAQTPSEDDLGSNSKVRKHSRKAKVKPTEKVADKAAAKYKSSQTPLEMSSNETTTRGDSQEDVLAKEQKTDNKEPLTVNSALDKTSKPKNKDNSTSIKQRAPPESKLSADATGPYPYPHLDSEDEKQENKVLDVLEEEAQEDESLGIKSYVIIGVSSGLLLLVLALVIALVVYRKRFPVRMGFGRKFSTFENPIYVSKDAQHSRELKRLTI